MAEFNGTIGITKEDSISSYKPEKSLNNRPNIMYIVLDDIGFAQLGCYGSTIHTPNIDKLAEGGLRYGIIWCIKHIRKLTCYEFISEYKLRALCWNNSCRIFCVQILY